MAEYEQDTTADAGEALDEIRRFVWAAADMTAAQEKIVARLDAVRAEIAATGEKLRLANDLAQRLAQRGMSIDRADMEALRAERAVSAGL